MLTILLLPAAFAQDTATTFDAHGFALAPLVSDPRSALEIHRPSRFDAGSGWVGGVFEYANEPLIRGIEVDGVLAETENVLDDLLALNFSAGWAPIDRLWLGATVPMYFASTGLGNVPQGVDLGDARLEAMVELVRPAAANPGEGGGFGLGLVPFVSFPTGATADFLGNGGFSGGGTVAMTGELSAITLGAEGGINVRPAVDLNNLSGGNEVLLGGHLGALFTPSWGLNAEVNARLPLERSTFAGSAAPVEALLSLRGRTHEGAHLVLGGAVALSRGAGAADFRVFVGGGWGSVAASPPPPDTDGDGIDDSKDRCPTQPETFNGKEDEDGCPEDPDPVSILTTVSLDGRGVTGAAIELVSGETRLHGVSGASPWSAPSQLGLSWKVNVTYGACYVGSDSVEARGDVNSLDVPLHAVRTGSLTVEVVDPDGKPVPMPQIALVSSAQGCVPDGVQPADTPIKTAPGTHTVRVWADGYREATTSVSVDDGPGKTVRVVLAPSKAKVTAKQIVIETPVFFDYNAATIRPESYAILDDVLNILQTHPEIRSLEVAGHTDSDGSDAYNLTLSQRRVESVRSYLVERGIAPERLVALGYGETRPIDSNANDTGKARNRRVEFNITARDAPQ